MDEKCPCGLELHYSNPQHRNYVESQVRRLGLTITVRCGAEAYEVNRHFLALHGIKAAELPNLAQRGLIRKKADTVLSSETAALTN